MIRDRDLFEKSVWGRLPVRRIDFLCYGPVTEHIDWVLAKPRIPLRLRSLIQNTGSTATCAA